MTSDQLAVLLHEGLKATRIVGACFVSGEYSETVLVDGDVDLRALADWLLPRITAGDV